jgi:predicted nucleic acid-binding protein
VEPRTKNWLQSLQKTATVLRVPEISDYELRRELLRAEKYNSIDRLNRLSQSCLIPLTPETMRKAAELWAWVRNQGQPTANKDSLDGDAILAAQAILQLKSFNEVIIVTTNLNHISRFHSEGICVADWQRTLNDLV